MKKLLFSVLFISALSNGQTAMPFEEAKTKGISPKVDTDYQGAIGPGGVFTTEADQQKHVDAYHRFLQGLGEYLAENNFKWDDVTKGFNRIYMDPSGKIDYFLYSFRPAIAPEKEKEFRRLLNEYISKTNFGITAPVKFAQCSPVTYTNTSN